MNAIAGRSRNDLTQYPVFPWVLADYTSEELDLSDPNVYRDLSKPIGALDDERAREARERYKTLEGPDGALPLAQARAQAACVQRDEGNVEHPLTGGMLPKFHHGTHYSSAGIVLHYLVRVEPFTMLAKSLQGGNFDVADRLFHSVAASWDGCLHNASDVKELTPEFYSQPGFLVNADGLDLGVRQCANNSRPSDAKADCKKTKGSDGTHFESEEDSERVHDVTLPPWAHGSAATFVAKMREALESEYVSAHLHQWIDLVFGHAQRGPVAIEHTNVFNWLTYEHAVDIDSIADAMQRKATQDQIFHFGQVRLLSSICSPAHFMRPLCSSIFMHAR